MNATRRFALYCLVASLSAPSLTGCFSSRWAMSDPKYAEKYRGPYEGDKIDKIERMAKQAVDARHVVGQAGLQMNLAASEKVDAAGVDADLFFFPYSWLEFDLNAQLLGGGEEAVLLWGGGMRTRLQVPSRLAPYVGLGLFAGSNQLVIDSRSDGEDNDEDGLTDEPSERPHFDDDYLYDDSYTLCAIYPEIGVHFWCTPRVRLSAGAAYYVTTEGRDHDFLYYSFGLGVLLGPGPNLEDDD